MAGLPLVGNCLADYNCCTFAYGHVVSTCTCVDFAMDFALAVDASGNDIFCSLELLTRLIETDFCRVEVVRPTKCSGTLSVSLGDRSNDNQDMTLCLFQYLFLKIQQIHIFVTYVMMSRRATAFVDAYKCMRRLGTQWM